MLITLYIGLAVACGMFVVEYYARVRELDFFEAKIANLQTQIDAIRADVTNLKMQNQRLQISAVSVPPLSLQSIGTAAEQGQLVSRELSTKPPPSRPGGLGSHAELRYYSTPSVWRRRPPVLSPDDESQDEDDKHHK